MKQQRSRAAPQTLTLWGTPPGLIWQNSRSRGLGGSYATPGTSPGRHRHQSLGLFFLLFRVGWHHIFGHAGHIVLQSPRPDGLPDTLTGLASACCSYRNSSIRVKIHRELSANRLAQVTPKGVIIKRFLGGLDKEMRRLDSLVREYLFLRQSFSPGLVRKAGLTERTPTLSLPARCTCCLL